MNSYLTVALVAAFLFAFNIYQFLTKSNTFDLILAILWLFVGYQNIKLYFANKS